MSHFIEGQDRSQVTLIPECLDDFTAEDNPVRVVDAFVAELGLAALGFEGTTRAIRRSAAPTGARWRPGPLRASSP
jgi:transposase